MMTQPLPELSPETRTWFANLKTQETEVRVFDLDKTAPHLRALIQNPLIPGMIVGTGTFSASLPSPTVSIGSLPPHHMIGNSVLVPRLAKAADETITNEGEAKALIDINTAAMEAEADPALKKKYFDEGIGYSLNVADKTVSFANAAIPALSAMGVGAALNLNTLSPGLSFASSAISAGKVWSAFADEDATIWKKSSSSAGLLSSLGALTLDLTGQYQGLSALLKVTSAGLILADTISGRAAIIGPKPS